MAAALAENTPEVIRIAPQPGPQTEFASSPADIVIFGGAAGGGKTYSILFEPLRHIHNPRFGAVIFRRTYPEITNEGGLWDEARSIYPLLGGRSRDNHLDYRFPSNAKIAFRHMQRDSDYQAWKGAQIALIEMDQLEMFTAKQFFYMLSRNRSTCGVRPYMRATCNPQPGWLADLIAWWWDQDTGYPIPERSGVVRYMARIREQVYWGDTRAALAAQFPDDPDINTKINSFTFIHADIYDNKILLEKDPGYIAKLESQGLVDRERLLKGNWKISEEAGKIFNRAWFKIVDAAPVGGQEVRFFDFAATDKTSEGKKKNDPDATASVRIRKVDGIYYIMDATEDKVGPSEVDRIFFSTAQADYERARSLNIPYRLVWEIEPGSAGKRESQRIMRALGNIPGKGVSSRSDKLVRAKPAAAQAEAGNVCLVRAPWNEALIEHLHNQPDLPHDDLMDALSGAFRELNDSFSSILEHYRRRAEAQQDKAGGADDEDDEDEKEAPTPSPAERILGYITEDKTQRR